MLAFSLLRLEKHHNKMITSNNTVIQRMTPITDPAMIPIEEPPPLSLPLCATDTPGVSEVVGVTVVVSLVDTIEVVVVAAATVSLVVVIAAVSLVVVIGAVSLVVVVVVIVVSLVVLVAAVA